MAVLLPGKFLCNPRTASVATSRTLLELPGARKVGYHHAAVDEVDDHAGEPTVATVRNPYDALVSWYHHLPDSDFGDFLRRYDHHPFIKGRPPDLFWQCGPDTHVLRFETVQHDLDAFLVGLGLPTLRLFRRNVTTSKTRPWRDYYDDRTAAIADERFGHVADRWGYDRLTPSRGRSPS